MWINANTHTYKSRIVLQLSSVWFLAIETEPIDEEELEKKACIHRIYEQICAVCAATERDREKDTLHKREK